MFKKKYLSMPLKKELKLIDVFAVSSGAMISSGLFVLPGLAFKISGPAMILSYILASLLIIPSLLAKAELTTAMPKAGGTYFFIDRSLGPVLGIFGGFANWFSISLKSAFALIGIGAFAIIIKPDISEFEIKLIAIAACLIFTLMNLISVKATGRSQVLLVIGLITILIIYIGRGFVLTHPDRYVPFMPKGFWSVISTAGLVFVSYGGLTKVSSIAEEVENPGRNIPLGMMISYGVVTLFYILAIGITVGVVDGQELSGSLIPLSLGGLKVFGTPGIVILSIAAMTAFITTANAGLLAASRSPLAMSRDQLLPEFFSRVNRKYKTPVTSILITSGFMIAVILFLRIEDLVKTASTLMIILFIMVNISVIVMRESRIQNYQPKFKLPLYPFLPIFALITYTFLLFEMGLIPILISALFLLFGIVIYFGYARKKVSRTSALMHVVERITAWELKSKTLGDELREIIIERDEIIEDRFDKLIKNCEILDIDESRKIEDAFVEISQILSARCQIDEKLIYNSFIEREKQSGTVIKPGLAIPHIIVPGKNIFDVLLVRAKKGLIFPGVSDHVHAMFVLIGSLDERNYHLRALMAIANIAQDSLFETRWLKARNREDLRDIILLSKRKRDI
ncbi:MAG: amino acid permease [Candidatus Marinimicrobia bacterium]|nr:amino acid permease [Candidatus Neomarinimicrobiota bacterium]